MSNALSNTPVPSNEPALEYAPGSPERVALSARVGAMASERVEVPCVIGGRELRTGRTARAVMPHDHRHVLADVHLAGSGDVGAAIDAASAAWGEWSRTPWEDRVAVFLRAAELLAGPWRSTLNAATMLGQSKTAHQAEIDAACELIDFWRFNAAYAAQIYAEQPVSSPGVWNRMEYRPLEGFVLAVTPFNFTSIAGNLPTAPALMGDTVVWKPASTSMLSAHYVMRLLEEAGLPPGVINLVFGPGAEIGDVALAIPGSPASTSPAPPRSSRGSGAPSAATSSGTRTTRASSARRAARTSSSRTRRPIRRRSWPAIIRGAFEYQGQKCSAASRLFMPRSLWSDLRERLVAEVESITMGDVADYRNYMGAVIDASSFATQLRAVEEARSDPSASVIVGGECDDSDGYFVRPTVIVTTDPSFRTMREELFGPVLTAYVYDDAAWEDTLRLVDSSTPYGLTGAVFARDRAAVTQASAALRHTAGNFYVNDKPTGAVVGQQPFGGARASGTNDKAGSMWNLIRWVSPRCIKETLAPPTDYRYPFLGGDD